MKFVKHISIFLTATLMANVALAQDGIENNTQNKNTQNIQDSLANDSMSASFEISPVLSFALTTGGETLGRVDFAYDDGSTSSRNIKAGGFWGIYGGVAVEFTGTPYTWQTLIGYHFDRESTDNGGINWKRYPIESVFIYNNETWSFGAGLNYSMKPTLKVAGFTTKFENAIGPVLMAAYNSNERTRYALKFTRIQYDFILTKEDLALIRLSEAFSGESFQPQPISGNTLSFSVDYTF